MVRKGNPPVSKETVLCSLGLLMALLAGVMLMHGCTTLYCPLAGEMRRACSVDANSQAASPVMQLSGKLRYAGKPSSNVPNFTP